MVSAIIVSAGKSLRMNTSMRKQYMLLGGYPVLYHALMAMNASSAVDEMILVVPEDDVDFCSKNIIQPANLSKKIRLVSGGSKRQISVYNGLKAVDEKSRIVIIHDGVRPFIRHEQIDACIKGAEESGACILGLPVYDTLKIVHQSCWINKTIQRDAVWLAQTPQAFQYSLIMRAHENAMAEGLTGTDDASLVEMMGQKVRIIEGTRRNIKITTKEDLEWARMLINKSNFLDPPVYP
jgi:2-C-methyl-D-erythritol 4-phosphate cytidylyltransferase